MKPTIRQSISLSLFSPKTAINLVSDHFLPLKVRNYPRIVNLFVTERCNFNCSMCHVDQSMRNNDIGKGISLELLSKVVHESTPYSPVFQIIGGEPTLYRDLFPLIRLIKEKNMITGMTTNGLRLSSMANEICSSGLNFLAISLDGHNEEIQYKRGNVPDSFDAIINGINSINEMKLGVFPIIRVATVITKNNYRYLMKIADLVFTLGVDVWSLSNYYFVPPSIDIENDAFLAKTGIGKDIWGDKLKEESGYFNKKEINIISKSLNLIQEKYGNKMRIDYDWGVPPIDFYSTKRPSLGSSCYVPLQEIFIRGNGNIEFCQAHKIGNIKTERVIDAWNSHEALYFRKIFEENMPMPACFRCCALDIKFDK